MLCPTGGWAGLHNQPHPNPTAGAPTSLRALPHVGVELGAQHLALPRHPVQQHLHRAALAGQADGGGAARRQPQGPAGGQRPGRRQTSSSPGGEPAAPGRQHVHGCRSQTAIRGRRRTRGPLVLELALLLAVRASDRGAGKRTDIWIGCSVFWSKRGPRLQAARRIPHAGAPHRNWRMHDSRCNWQSLQIVAAAGRARDKPSAGRHCTRRASSLASGFRTSAPR